MKDSERDEQIYQEMATLRDENSVLKEKIESLANQNKELRSQTGVDKIKLEYFGPYGRADPIRFLLYHAEVNFDDVAISFEEWGERKASGRGGEFNCLPIVTVGDKEMGQTNAVLRSLGTKYGCYDPNDHLSVYYTDVILDVYADMFDACVPILFFMNDKSEEEKQEAFRQTM